MASHAELYAAIQSTVKKMASQAELYAQMEVTARTFMENYTKVISQGPAILSSNLTADCKRYFAPSSFLRTLGLPDDFVYTNKTYERDVALELRVWEAASCEIRDLVVDIRQRRASAQMVYVTKLRGYEPEFRMEIAWFLELTDDGKRIRKIVEVMPTGEVLQYMGVVNDLLKAQGKIR